MCAQRSTRRRRNRGRRRVRCASKGGVADAQKAPNLCTDTRPIQPHPLQAKADATPWLRSTNVTDDSRWKNHTHALRLSLLNANLATRGLDFDDPKTFVPRAWKEVVTRASRFECTRESLSKIACSLPRTYFGIGRKFLSP